MSAIRFICALLVSVIRKRLVVFLILVGAAYLFSGTVAARPPSPGKIPNGNVYYCGACHESGHVFSDGSPSVPSLPVHGNAMQIPFLNTTPTKTWTTDLANQDSDGDGFTNGEELQDPAGVWAIGQPDPGDVSFVSNPSDNSAANDAHECDLAYRATPPAPLLLDVIGYVAPAQGTISFGASVRSPLPIDYIRYTVKNGSSQTVYDNFSAAAPFRSSAWDTSVVPDGNYTITALVVERRAKPGATPRTSSRSESFAVKNSAPVFGPSGEVVGTPAQPCDIPERLNGIAAISADDAWLVGTRFVDGFGGSNEQILIKHWNGARWASVIGPNASTYFNALHAAAATSANDVWAAGEYDDGSLTRTLIEHWDGVRWQIVASPNLGTSNNRLAGIAAMSANNAWAVGSYDDGNGGSLPLILRWNGSSWQSVAVPSPSGASEVSLRGIAAVSASDIWAVGSYTDFSGNTLRKTLTLHWNGSQWKIVASPNPKSFVNALNSVTAVAGSDVWAVGYTSDGGGYKTLALHWTGTNWQAASTPSPGSPNNELLAVAAAAANDIWAAGYAGISADDGQTLALHWDGAAWKTVARPDSGSGTLNALDITSTGEAWAAGTDTTNSSVTRTLAERYVMTRPPPSARFAAATASVSESAGKATITVQLSSAPTQPVSVQYATSNGTAAAPGDYTAASGTLTFNAGQVSTSFDITIANDSLDEPDETVNVALSAPHGATLGTPSNMTLTIADDDTPTVTIGASDPSAAEAGPDAGQLTITRSSSTTASLVVHYTVDGSATPGADYSALSGTATIATGQKSATIAVAPINDPSVEGNETVVVSLSASSAYTIGVDASATVTIADDDTPTPSVTISASDPSAAEAGSQAGSLTVTRSGSTAAPLVAYYTVGGTATAGSDYTALAGTIAIPAGQASATIAIAPIDDGLVEGSEIVVVTLSANPAYTVGASASATVTITDNDTAGGPGTLLYLPVLRR